jgi:hypothetical protein
MDSTVTDAASAAAPRGHGRNEDHPLWKNYIWTRDHGCRSVGTFEEYVAEQEQYELLRQGKICQRCKRKLTSKAKLWRARGIHNRVEMICHRCWMAGRHGPYSFYGATSWTEPETLPCEGCGRLIVGVFDGLRVAAPIRSEGCRGRRQVKERSARRAAARAELICVTCGNSMHGVRVPSRNDARYCSNACRQKAYRERKR